jgi:hypothetical protein
MKKLEDIPKKQVFDVPEGYFEKLTSTIQARVAEKESRRAITLLSLPAVIRYALPALVLVAVGIFWFQNNASQTDAESILASVSTEDLVAYLNDSEISTDELMNAAEFDEEDLDDIESEVYKLHFEDLDLEDMQLDETDPEI